MMMLFLGSKKRNPEGKEAVELEVNTVKKQ